MTVRLFVLATAVAVASSCFFELAEVVTPSAGGAGGIGGGSGGAAPTHVLTITVGDVSGQHVDFPVLVALDATRIDYALTDGEDLRFFDMDGAPLSHEIERWDESGRSIVWVKIPLLETGAQFRAQLGDAGSAVDPTAVWSEYVAVYHLNDEQARDSGADGHHATAMDVSEVTGQLAGALDFNGTSSDVFVGFGKLDFDIQPGQGRSVSLWFKRALPEQRTDTLFSNQQAECCEGYEMLLLADQFANVRSELMAGPNCCQHQYIGTLALPGGGAQNVAWNHIVLTIDRQGGVGRNYIAGSLHTELADLNVTDPMSVGEAHIGNGHEGFGFLGSIDEVRIGRRAFDEDWVAAQYLSQVDALLSFGPLEAVR